MSRNSDNTSIRFSEAAAMAKNLKRILNLKPFELVLILSDIHSKKMEDEGPLTIDDLEQQFLIENQGDENRVGYGSKSSVHLKLDEKSLIILRGSKALRERVFTDLILLCELLFQNDQKEIKYKENKDTKDRKEIKNDESKGENKELVIKILNKLPPPVYDLEEMDENIIAAIASDKSVPEKRLDAEASRKTIQTNYRPVEEKDKAPLKFISTDIASKKPVAAKSRILGAGKLEDEDKKSQELKKDHPPKPRQN